MTVPLKVCANYKAGYGPPGGYIYAERCAFVGDTNVIVQMSALANAHEGDHTSDLSASMEDLRHDIKVLQKDFKAAKSKVDVIENTYEKVAGDQDTRPLPHNPSSSPSSNPRSASPDHRPHQIVLACAIGRINEVTEDDQDSQGSLPDHLKTLASLQYALKSKTHLAMEDKISLGEVVGRLETELSYMEIFGNARWEIKALEQSVGDLRGLVGL
ncbi:hypothetical protein IAR50_006229 [Cryptococcus sp. DSM 104548]